MATNEQGQCERLAPRSTPGSKRSPGLHRCLPADSRHQGDSSIPMTAAGLESRVVSPCRPRQDLRAKPWTVCQATTVAFDPQVVKKRQRRLTSVDQSVLSLTARGLTTGEISVHLAEVYRGVGIAGHAIQDHR